MPDTTRPFDASPPTGADLDGLRGWLDRSPTPFHVVATASSVLGGAGFVRVDSMDEELPAAGWFAVDGALLAWRLGDRSGSYRIVGAHTDSPNLRVKPHPDSSAHGWSQLGIEVYGGVLLNSWLDRDLGLAGRVIDPDGTAHLFDARRALARIPQLAIHLDRNVNEGGLVLDKQAHMLPVWGTEPAFFLDWLAELTGLRSVSSFDAHLYDLAGATIVGHDSSLLASARLDNQLSCWAAVNALASVGDSANTRIVVLNDHEEVGSESVTGAAGPMLERLVTLVSHQFGLGPGAHFDALSRSWCLSADNAHAIHPNYPDRHEPRHAPRLNLGPALKLNGNQRYATSARGAAFLTSLATSHSIPLQTFVSRNNVPCGSTIGPITATRLGIEAIDIGVPQLSMHSAREMCGADDPIHLVNIARAFLGS